MTLANFSRICLFPPLDRSETAKYLIDQGALAGVQDNAGSSVMTFMISKMPPVAKERWISSTQQTEATDDSISTLITWSLTSRTTKANTSLAHAHLYTLSCTLNKWN